MDYSKYLDEISKCTTSGLTEKEKLVLIKIIKLSYSKKGISSYFRLKRGKLDFDEEPHLNNLIKKGFIERRRGKILGEGISYDLTTCCLFFIFLNMQNYPNSLLLKYQENVILSTLLYPYFVTSSIKDFYPLLSESITQYLRLCCRTSLNLTKAIKNASSPADFENLGMVLEHELGWHARILVIKALMLTGKTDVVNQGNTQTNRFASSELIQDKKFIASLLANDHRFLNLFNNVKNEFADGYRELLNQRKNPTEPV